MPIIAFCTPHGDRVPMRFTQRLVEISQSLPKAWTVMFAEVDYHVVSLGRHKIVDTVLAYPEQVDYLFWVDDDVIPPVQALNQMLAAKSDIISALYFSRHHPYPPQMYIQQPDGPGYIPVGNYPQGIISVDVVGGGCMLVKADVYRHLRDLPPVRVLDIELSPWYEFFVHRGEDFYFCERARYAGYRIEVDTRIQCVHMGQTDITEEVFRAVNHV